MDAEGRNEVVAAAKPEVSEIGVKILEMGGNTLDAAIATAFAIGVLEPNASDFLFLFLFYLLFLEFHLIKWGK